MTQRGRTLLSLAAILALTSTAGACASSGGGGERASGGFLGIGGGDEAEPVQGEIGVNSFLWQASLDTLSFMPLASTDPFGGVIITDWHADPSVPNERFRAQVYVLDTRLRADALNVSLFRQSWNGSAWVDAAIDPDTEVQIENAILNRARQLRLSTLNDNN
jgi:Domain of unknown function (DUF3576)